MINEARTFFSVSDMLLGAFVIGIIGFLVNAVLRKLEGKLLHWRGTVRA
jgi:ABC-type nitrate/sulfonate/bicarbonate transport system permease component